MELSITALHLATQITISARSPTITLLAIHSTQFIPHNGVGSEKKIGPLLPLSGCPVAVQTSITSLLVHELALLVVTYKTLQSQPV